jgi:hypothetical protein
MCFVFLWCTRFLIRARFPLLLAEMVVAPFWLEPNSLKNLCNQIASQLACDVAIYSALVVNSATVGCFQLDQVTMTFSKEMQNQWWIFSYLDHLHNRHCKKDHFFSIISKPIIPCVLKVSKNLFHSLPMC